MVAVRSRKGIEIKGQETNMRVTDAHSNGYDEFHRFLHMEKCIKV